jgi:uncharacterized membrane protein
MTKRKTLRRLGAAAVLVGTAGSALRWIRDVGARRRRVDMRMTVVVERPVSDVFEFCRDFENFARIIDIPLEIEDFQDGRSHWRVPSRAGSPTEWEANISKYVPNSVIAWESKPGSPVKASGTMRFSPLSKSESRVDITIKYVPLDQHLGKELRAIVTGGNAKRLRGAVAAASRELSRARS